MALAKVWNVGLTKFTWKGGNILYAAPIGMNIIYWDKHYPTSDFLPDTVVTAVEGEIKNIFVLSRGTTVIWLIQQTKEFFYPIVKGFVSL